jgi:quercetin dioxygenase-like cupin family protein
MPEGGTMKSTSARRRVGAAAAFALAALLGLAAVATATPSIGTVSSVTIGAGSMPDGTRLRAKADTNTVVAEFTFGPNSSTGWHTHPGKTLVTVQSGTFTVYHDNCRSHTYGPGDAFVEIPSSVHVGRNETDDPVELGVVFFSVPIGGSPRIDQPQPDSCDVS